MDIGPIIKVTRRLMLFRLTKFHFSRFPFFKVPDNTAAQDFTQTTFSSVSPDEGKRIDNPIPQHWRKS